MLSQPAAILPATFSRRKKVNPMNARNVLCICIIAKDAWEYFLDCLMLKQRKRPLPEEVKDIYDEVHWKEHLAITNEEMRVSIAHTACLWAVDFALIFSPFFSWVDAIAGDDAILALLLSILIIDALKLPVNYLMSFTDEFAIQKKYGQSNRTPGSFTKDFLISAISNTVISAIVTCITGQIFMAAVENILEKGPSLAIALDEAESMLPIIFSLAIVALIAESAIDLCRYRFKPMPRGELREEIERMLRSSKKHVRWLTVYNESARSNEKNAFLLNIPGLRMISVADNIMEKDSPRQTLATIAHEIGHLKHRRKPYDLCRYIVTTAFVALLVLLLANVEAFIPAEAWIRSSFNLSHTSLFLVILFINYVLKPVIFLAGIPSHLADRSKEYEADQNAVLEGYGQELADSLKEWYRDELRFINPHPLVEFLYFGHPGLPNRLRAIDAGMEGRRREPRGRAFGKSA